MAAATFTFALVLLAMVTFGPAAPASARENPKCLGRTATIVGTPGNDTIRGTFGNDVIVGLAGNDKIFGLGGNDIICGGRGWDRIYGQSGADKLFGGPGMDQLFGGGGSRDRCYGGTQEDRARLCEGRVSVRPFALLEADDEVTRLSLRRINLFRRNNSDFEVGGVMVPTRPDTLAPLYLSSGHNRVAKNLLDAKLAGDTASGDHATSRIFRFFPDFNSLATVHSSCTDLSSRPTTALPGIISQALVASPDLKLLATSPTADRIGIAWQERNHCLYWVVVFGSPLV